MFDMVKQWFCYRLDYAIISAHPLRFHWFYLSSTRHRQNKIICEQNTVLAQCVSQIERVTILEERDRLANTGHSCTSIVMGLEALRLEFFTSEGQHKLDSLLHWRERA